MGRDLDPNPLQDLPEPTGREAEARLRAGQSIAQVTRFLMASPRGLLRHEGYLLIYRRVAAMREWLQLHSGEQASDPSAPAAPHTGTLVAQCLDAMKQLAARVKDCRPIVALSLALTVREVEGELEQRAHGQPIDLANLVPALVRIDQALRDVPPGAVGDEIDPIDTSAGTAEHALPGLAEAVAHLDDANRMLLRKGLESVLRGVQLQCGLHNVQSLPQQDQPAAPRGEGGDGK